MPEIDFGAHTVRSHGAKVARIHVHDWIILLLLVVIEVILNVIEPFHRFVGKDMMTDLTYPLKDNTVPTWALPVCIQLKEVASMSSQRRNNPFNYLILFPLVTDNSNNSAIYGLSCVLLLQKGCL